MFDLVEESRFAKTLIVFAAHHKKRFIRHQGKVKPRTQCDMTFLKQPKKNRASINHKQDVASFGFSVYASSRAVER